MDNQAVNAATGDDDPGRFHLRTTLPVLSCVGVGGTFREAIGAAWREMAARAARIVADAESEKERTE